MNQNETAAPEKDPLSSAIDGILSNPEMLSMISSMADKLKNSSGANANPEHTEESASASSTPSPSNGVGGMSDMLGALAPLLSSELSRSSPADDKRACLLRALKPYLSEGRSEAIEYIIKFSRLSELLKRLT